LLANCRQIGIKLAQRLMTNPVPSVSAISLCFVTKACVHNVTANWQQKPSKFGVTSRDTVVSRDKFTILYSIVLFDDKLTAKIEQTLRSAV